MLVFFCREISHMSFYNFYNWINFAVQVDNQLYIFTITFIYVQYNQEVIWKQDGA